MKKPILALCLPILALVVIAGCSKSDDGNGVATVAGATPPTATANLSVLEQGRRHAQCMRDHGVPEADPRVNPDGGVSVGGGYDKHTLDQNVLDQAIEACKLFQVILSPEDQALKLAGAREVAQCMRSHGVESYPDPDPNDLGKSLPDEVRDDPDFDQARAICDTKSPNASAS
jgi:poly(3-hydroxybutyrate) depolymerase